MKTNKTGSLHVIYKADINFNNMRFKQASRDQIKILDRIAGYANALNPFHAGDEFFGEIKNVKENELSLNIQVQPLVAENIGMASKIINITNINGDVLFPKLYVRSVLNKENGLLNFILEKPVELIDSNVNLEGRNMVNSLDWSLPFRRQIFANYNDDCIRLYQIFSKEISSSLMATFKFGKAFNYNRVTWVKPSFLWTMQRSKFLSTKGEASVLAINIKRDCFERLLENSHIANPVLGAYFNSEKEFSKESREQPNTVQWDPDKNIIGKRLNRRALQLGLHPKSHQIFEENIVAVADVTPLVKKIQGKLQDKKDCEYLLPLEFPYPTTIEIIHMLEMNQYYIDESKDVLSEMQKIAGK